MAFIVTGLSRTGPMQIDCDTPSEALEKAAELVRDGYADVLIADEAGLQYTPVEFGRLFHSRGQDFSPSGTFLKTPQPTRLEERNMTRLTLAAAIVALTATTAAAAPLQGRHDDQRERSNDEGHQFERGGWLGRQGEPWREERVARHGRSDEPRGRGHDGRQGREEGARGQAGQARRRLLRQRRAFTRGSHRDRATVTAEDLEAIHSA